MRYKAGLEWSMHTLQKQLNIPLALWISKTFSGSFRAFSTSILGALARGDEVID